MQDIIYRGIQKSETSLKYGIHNLIQTREIKFQDFDKCKTLWHQINEKYIRFCIIGH